jgi:hypothetical protein
LELSFEFYDGFFLVLEGAAYRDGSSGLPVLKFQADEPMDITCIM